MSSDDYDFYAMDEGLSMIANEAIDGFVKERLQSYYLENPDLLLPAFESYNYAGKMLTHKSYSASYLFYTTSIELFLKVGILKPILYGMVHNESIAVYIADRLSRGSGFKSHKKIICDLCLHAADFNLASLQGITPGTRLIDQACEVQEIRNKIIHQGKILDKDIDRNEAQYGMAKQVSFLILHEVLEPVLNNLDIVFGKNLTLIKDSEISEP